VPAVPPPAVLGPLQEREFRNLYAGQAVSVVGDGLVPVALSFAVLESLHGGAGQLGIVLACNAVSLAAFALIGGVWADRLSRRRVMLAADVTRMAVQALSAALLIAGGMSIALLAALQVAYGAAEAFFRPAATGLLPETISPGRLQQANALLGLTYNAGTVAGPAIGGVLVVLAGPGGALAFDAATFAVSALFLLRLRVARAPASGARRPFLHELAAGFREVLARRWLWATILVASAWLFLVFAPFYVLGPVVCDRDLGGAGAWATILAAYGLGGVAGGALALRWSPRRPLFAAALLFTLEAPAPALLALGAPLWAIAAGGALGGASFGVFGALWETTMQRLVPAEALSRVSSFDWMGSLALLPAGYALAGPAGAALGVDAVLLFAAGAGVVLALALAADPDIRRLRRPA
jgi:predicted MFS family arabinose efflux permease